MKLISISLIFLMIFSVSALAIECTQSGFEFCDYCTYDNGPAHAYAKIYWSVLDENGLTLNEIITQQGGYAVGRVLTIFGSEGNHRYFYKNIASWDSVVCNENGCTGGLNIDGSASFTLASTGEIFTDCFAFIAWDRDDNSGYWAWTRCGRGFIGSGNCFSIPVVECYQDSDCNGMLCDKTADWTQWSCVNSICGNGIVEGTEDCDGINLNGKTCQDFGYTGGTLSCSAGCTFDMSQCTIGPVCGNGIIESPEQCDGTNLGGATCESLGLGVGTLSCKADCSFYTDNCYIPCDCTEWIAGKCSNTSTTEVGYREYSRTCTPTGCDVEFKTVVDDECKKSNVVPIIIAIVVVIAFIGGLYAYIRMRLGKGFRKPRRRYR